MATASSSPELPRCGDDTELSLGLGGPAPRAPAPTRCRATAGELRQKQKQAAATPTPSCGGRTATELQAMAILRVARRAAAADEDDDEGAAGLSSLSMRRSMEWFLQRRREARRLSLRGVATAALPSSSSFSCLTDSDSSSLGK